MDNHDDVGENALNFQALMDSKVPNYCVVSTWREWVRLDDFRVGGGALGKRYKARLCETDIYGAHVVSHVPWIKSSGNWLLPDEYSYIASSLIVIPTSSCPPTCPLQVHRSRLIFQGDLDIDTSSNE